MVVPWVEAKDVPLCPQCHRSFTIVRRKHHCRLCGFVLCDKCSLNLPDNMARSFVSGVPVDQQPTSSSLEPEGFRICEHCYELLHDRFVRVSWTPPTLSTLYDSLRTIRSSVEVALAEFQESEGVNAQVQRTAILKDAEKIDAISKRILNLEPTGPECAVIQKNIRAASTSFLKENIISLPSLKSTKHEPAIAASPNSEPDLQPLKQQIKNIQEYIQTAR